MNSIAVSVLVPICNVEKYLRECLDSLLVQTLKNIEFICLNDGSTDSSLDILREYELKDSRIVVVDKSNSGYGDSMNVGLGMARGEYVGIVESDDFASRDMFEKLYSAAVKHNADVVKSNFYSHTTGSLPECDEFTENLYGCVYNTVFNPKIDQEVFLGRPAIWSGLYKRSFLLENEIKFLPTPGASFQDTAFNFKVFSAATRALLIKDAFLHYRIDNANSSVKSQKKVFCICEEYKEIWRFAQADSDRFRYLSKRIPQLQFGGYVWNLNRLTPGLQYSFYCRLIEEFQEIKKADFLDREYFDSGAWTLLSSMLANADDFYIEQYGPFNVSRSILIRFTTDFPVSQIEQSSMRIAKLLPNDSEIFVSVSSIKPEISNIFLSLHEKDKRFTNLDEISDSWISETINISSLRGEKLIAMSFSSVAQVTEMLKSLSGCGQIDDLVDISSRVFSCNVCSSLDNQVLFVPLIPLLIDSNTSVSDVDTPLVFSGDEAVGCIVGEDYDRAYNSFINLINEFASASVELDYSACRNVYTHLLPIWKRIKSAYNLLAYTDRLDRDEPSVEGLYVLEKSSSVCLDKRVDVSVIIPVYNMQAYIKESLQSVLQQDFDAYEVLCVNDGSTDDSLSILESISGQYSNIRVISQLNGGAGSARNCGVANARGKYLLFIDPDDFYPSCNVISSLYDAAIKSSSRIVGGSFTLLNADGTQTEKFFGENSFYTFEHEGLCNITALANDYGWIRFMYARSLFTENAIKFPSYSWYEDPVFLMRVASKENEFYMIPEPVYLYRSDYKTINWDVLKARSILRGIEENLTVAARMEASGLYTTLVRRIEFDYFEAIINNIADEEVLSRLISIQANLDCKLIDFVRESGKKTHILRPLVLISERDKDIDRSTAVVRLAKRLSSTSVYRKLQNCLERLRGVR